MNLQGTYTDIEEIGSGGGGTVYKAFHIRMQKYVVLKKIHSDIQNKVDIRGELDILKNLRHSYLPAVLDFIEDNGAIYTVMEYIPGESFEDLLGKGVKFSQIQVIKYATQLAEVLTYLHAQKPAIIHGDIKPANIMLTPDDNICLLDFNVSQIQGGINVNVGYTPGFAAPEQVNIVQSLRNNYDTYNSYRRNGTGTVLLNAQDKTVLLNNSDRTVLLDSQERTVLLDYANDSQTFSLPSDIVVGDMDVRTDIYGFGATVYAILCGKVPNEDYTKIIAIQETGTECSEGMARIIGKSMAFAREDRFQNAEELLNAILNISKVDSRYKHLVLRQQLTTVFCIIGIAVCIIITLLGKERMGYEKNEKYLSVISEMESIQGNVSDNALNEMNELYERAISILPDRAEAHYQKALSLYYACKYEEMLSFLMDNVLVDISMYSNSETGDFYFLAANSYYELGENDQALTYYKTALKYHPYNSLYYSDYAIALAKAGDIEEAKKVLEQAVGMGMSNDKVLLAQGEIFATQGLQKEAIECLKECITDTDDSYIILRAYIMWANLFDVIKDEKSLLEKKNVLKEAVIQVLPEYQAILLERLAQVNIDLGDLTSEEQYNRDAIENLEKIVSLGWGTYVTNNNIGILYQEVGDFESAKKQFLSMLEIYGEDYRVYKRLAFLEVDIQASIANLDRNYQGFLEYYEKAKVLFADSKIQADKDMEMQLLNQVYNQLVEGNWF